MLLATKLTSDLYEGCAFLRIEEVSICLELGAQEEYGEFAGLNYRTVFRWLKAYRYSERRYKAVKQLREAEDRKKLPPVSEAYNELCMRRMICRAYQDYRRDPKADILLPSVIYQELQRKGYIRHTLQVKNEAMEHFARWRPRGNLRIDEDTRRELIKLKAQEWLLKKYFASIDELPFQEAV